MMYGRLDPGVLGGEALVSVGHHLLLLVAGPGVEDITDILLEDALLNIHGNINNRL